MPDSQRKQYPTRGVDNRPLNFIRTTTSASADQEIDSRPIPDGKKYCIQTIFVEVIFTTISATATILGTLSIRFGGSIIIGPVTAVNPTSSAPFGFTLPIPEEYVVEGDGTKKLDAVCTPTSTTSMKWIVHITGYERD